MKSHTNLYGTICAFENLLHAASKAQRGKRFKGSTARFNFFLERELLTLQDELLTQRYRPRFCRQYRYVFKADIAQYFPSIDHDILFAILSRTTRDRRTRWLMRQIIDASNPQPQVLHYFPGDDLFTPTARRKGLPIGNLTSQLFANIYLNGLDHFVKETLRCHAYIRYCDDFVVFSDDKRVLWQVKEAMATYLAGLRLHATKCQVMRTQDGIDFLGYRIFPTHCLLRQTTARRFIRRLRLQSKLYARGLLSLPCIDRSVQSWLGHVTHAATYGLQRSVFSAIAFRRTPVPSADSAGEGQAVPGRPARRRVEQ